MGEPMGEALGRLLRETYERVALAEWVAQQPDDEWTTTPEIALTVQKARAWMPVSCCDLTDTTGENHCEHPPPPRPPWHRRLRWRLGWKWRALRMRVGSWVAGVDLDRDDDDG